jgi:acid stress chaperone HdeB
MSELKPLLLGSISAVLVVSAALAQANIDVGKITCDRYVLDKDDARTVAVWLNGFYAGRLNKTVVDTQQLERDADRVAQYCMSHRDMVVMQAFEAMAE